MVRITLMMQFVVEVRHVCTVQADGSMRSLAGGRAGGRGRELEQLGAIALARDASKSGCMASSSTQAHSLL